VPEGGRGRKRRWSEKLCHDSTAREKGIIPLLFVVEIPKKGKKGKILMTDKRFFRGGRTLPRKRKTKREAWCEESVRLSS